MSVQRLASTDDAGRFVFRNLPAGNYTAPRAVKPGFVPVVDGQKRVGGIGPRFRWPTVKSSLSR